VRVDIEGRVALVTGGVRNIGRATALALAGSGATVAVTWAHDPDAAAETVAAVEAVGGRAGAYRVDLADVAALRATVAQVEAELGGVSILVNNAGRPEEIAAAILYLCSPEAGYGTGEEIRVTGGRSPLTRQPWNEYR
jgi:NAD(P)-dependent dehydrogenase (short-subunit alcohol dehydrogenase family)